MPGILVLPTFSSLHHPVYPPPRMPERDAFAPPVPKTPSTARQPTTTSLVPYQPQSPRHDHRPVSRAPRLLQSIAGSPGPMTGGRVWQSQPFHPSLTNNSRATSSRGGPSLNTTTTTNFMGSTMQSVRAKPNLVADLEAFMQRELLHLSKSAENCGPFERIPIVSEAFRAFIARCGDYGDLLSHIKQEYDDAVAAGLKAQRSNHRLELVNDNSMEYLSHIVSAEKISSEALHREKDRKMQELTQAMEQQTKEYATIVEEHHELRAKVTHLSRIVEDLTLTNKIMTDGLKQETLHRSLMVQQGKKLKGDNDKLARKVQMLEFKIRNDALLQSTEDAPQASSTASPTIGKTGKLDGSVSPHASSNTLRESGGGLRREPSTVNLGDVGDVSVEHVLDLEERLLRALQLLHKESQERKSLEMQMKETESTRIDRPLTPRPNWASLRSLLPRWSIPQESSEDILKAMISAVKARLREDQHAIEVAAMSQTIRDWFSDENLCESDLVRGRVRTFVGRGTGPHVPPFLRFHGQLRNRRLNKGDVENMLKDFWKDRKQRSETSGGGMSGTTDEGMPSTTLTIQEAFLDWLTRKTGGRLSAIELGYNIVDVCTRHTHDPDCGMMLLILNNEVNEAAYFDQLGVVDQLRMVMRHHDKSDHGLLKRARVNHIILKLFPAKSLECMLKLRFALLSHLNISNDTIRYAEIFEEDGEGNQSRFIEIVREQHLQEMTEYIVDLEEAVRAAPNADGALNVSMVRTAIRFLDAKMPQKKLDAIVACGLGVKHASPDMNHMPVNIEEFLRNVRRGILLMPFTRRDESGASAGSGTNDGDVDVENTDAISDVDDDLSVDDSEIDPSARAALQLMDQQLRDQAARLSGGDGGERTTRAPVPQVVEDTMRLLKPSTVEAIKSSKKRGGGVVVTAPQ